MTDLRKLIYGDSSDPRIELEELFGSDGAHRLAPAQEWGRGVIRDAGLTADQQVHVIRALRRAEPRLSLKPATFLAAQLAR